MSVKPSLDHPPAPMLTPEPEHGAPKPKPGLGKQVSFSPSRGTDGHLAGAMDAMSLKDASPGPMRRVESTPSQPAPTSPAAPSGLRGLSLPAGVATKLPEIATHQTQAAALLLAMDPRHPTPQEHKQCMQMLELASHKNGQGFKSALMINANLQLLRIICHAPSQAKDVSPSEHKALLRSLIDSCKDSLGENPAKALGGLNRNFFSAQMRKESETVFAGTRLVHDNGVYTMQESAGFGYKGLTPAAQDMVATLHANLLTATGVAPSALAAGTDKGMGPLTESIRAKMKGLVS